MATEESKAEAREFEDFLRGIAADREFTDTLLDGSSINIILVVPHAADASRAAALVDRIIDTKLISTVENFGRLIRLACVSCIKGVTYENVVAFLDKFPPNPPIVRECLRLLGITDEQMQKIGIESAEES